MHLLPRLVHLIKGMIFFWLHATLKKTQKAHTNLLLCISNISTISSSRRHSDWATVLERHGLMFELEFLFQYIGFTWDCPWAMAGNWKVWNGSSPRLKWILNIYFPCPNCSNIIFTYKKNKHAILYLVSSSKNVTNVFIGILFMLVFLFGEASTQYVFLSSSLKQKEAASEVHQITVQFYWHHT